MSKERGIHPAELFLNLSDESDGKTLFNYRMFNQNLEAAGEMFLSDRIFPGLGMLALMCLKSVMPVGLPLCFPLGA
ncbi:MAG: hypothetical protein Ct9H300mP20_05500 [Gammaproteobacteria bacterium]|nr:MAG: hypothetical protein Ct9H300mP20_05500 [Gammaproteobacteria bacterium]